MLSRRCAANYRPGKLQPEQRESGLDILSQVGAMDAKLSACILLSEFVEECSCEIGVDTKVSNSPATIAILYDLLVHIGLPVDKDILTHCGCQFYIKVCVCVCS